MESFIASFLGAIIQELLHWVDLKQELGKDIQITTSRDYWIITIIAIIVFTFATPIIIKGILEEGKIENWHYLVTAFSFPAVLRKLAKVILKSNANQEKDMGVLQTQSFKSRNYFKIF